MGAACGIVSKRRKSDMPTKAHPIQPRYIHWVRWMSSYFLGFDKARTRSGRNSFITLNPMLVAIVMPNLTAPSPVEL
jgi:hypothetical protein